VQQTSPQQVCSAVQHLVNRPPAPQQVSAAVQQLGISPLEQQVVPGSQQVVGGPFASMPKQPV
jgi:hypothetical protein